MFAATTPDLFPHSSIVWLLMLKYVLNIVVYLALALWIGSLVFFGAGVASLVFQPGMLPSRTIAGALNSAVLGRLGTIEIVAGVLLIGGALYAAVHYRQWLNWLALVIAVAMVATAAYYTGSLYPKMDNLRVMIGDFDHLPEEKMVLKREFDRGHELYSTLVKGVLGGGMLVLILHTIALVRFAELHARQSRKVEEEWRSARKETNQVLQESAKSAVQKGERNGGGPPAKGESVIEAKA